MTRFARAKGSKASNERVPEEATSWHVMRQQLEQQKLESVENKKRKEFETVRQENYKNFLDERDNEVKTEWAQFDGSKTNQNEVRKSKNKASEEENLRNDSDLKEIIEEIEQVLTKDDGEGSNNKLKKKLKVIEGGENNKIDDNNDAPQEASAKVNVVNKKIKIKLPKKAPLKIPPVNKIHSEQMETKKDKEINENSSQRYQKNNTNGKINMNTNQINLKKSYKDKRSKNKIIETNLTNAGNPKTPIEEMTEDQIKRINKKKEKRMRQLQNKKKFKAEQREKALKEQEEQTQNMRKRKLPKERDNEVHKRKKPDSKITTMNINGIDIEIDYVDGFPVMKEDAERLRKLRKTMISKGIPKSEVQVTLKLERRKAEKALARERKKVCFNCRMAGHVLSECSNLNEASQQEIAGTGICFKCGSTEHTHFECRVVKNDDYRYATCFICQQQGHISRQCPDNNRGLYPKGGACRVCGDVTHLKKDCPKYQVEQESQMVKLDTLDNENLEGLPEEKKINGKSHKKANKVVKF